MRSLIKVSGIATLILICVLVSDDSVLQGSGANPPCLSSWPPQEYDGALREKDYGHILFSDFYTDADGDRWFVIRSADSNGYTTVRAYHAEDGGDGYIAGAPDETCYLLVRRPGDTVDSTEPRQITFPMEKEENPTPPATPRPKTPDPFAKWNKLEPQPWWKKSEPYSCLTQAKDTSPWIEAGMTDLGGSDPLSLIRFFGNGSYLRYGFMGFEGCTSIRKYPGRTHLDPPVDPAYYSLGDLDIAVDIARVPPDAPGWVADDGARETMGMAEAVNILNTHVAAYFGKISEGKLRMRFHAGNDFALEGEGSPNDVQGQQLRLAGVMDCRGKAADSYPCDLGAPGGLNRLLLTDVTTDRGGDAFNGSVRMGLVSLSEANPGDAGTRAGPCLDGLAPLPCRGPVGRRGRRAAQPVQQRPGLHVRAGAVADAGLASGHALNPGGEPLRRGVDRPLRDRAAPERFRDVHAATASGTGLPDACDLVWKKVRLHDDRGVGRAQSRLRGPDSQGI